MNHQNLSTLMATTVLKARSKRKQSYDDVVFDACIPVATTALPERDVTEMVGLKTHTNIRHGKA